MFVGLSGSLPIILGTVEAGLKGTTHFFHLNYFSYYPILKQYCLLWVS